MKVRKKKKNNKFNRQH